VAADQSGVPPTIDPDPDEEQTPRERLAALIERRLDIPMAVLAGLWELLIAYGTFFVESRAERAAAEESGGD
jgi:hypothetical protein